MEFETAIVAARTFALGPAATDDWSAPRSWMERVQPRDDDREPANPAQKERRKSLRSTFLSARGSLRYRAGQWEESAKSLREGVALHAEGGRFRDWLFLALAEHRLGHADAARAAAAKARAVPKPGTLWQTAEAELLTAELDAALPPGR